MGNTFNYEAFKAVAIEQLKAGKKLSGGKDGVLAPFLENLLNSALDGEMDAHPDQDERELGNRRNGHTGKQVQTLVGEITVPCCPKSRTGSIPSYGSMPFTTR